MDTAALKNLGISEFIIGHLENHDLDSPLGFRCQPPFNFQSSPIAQRSIIPLWECGMLLWYFDPKTKMFENCSLQDINDIWHRYVSLQSVLAELFLDLHEDEVELDTLRGLAERSGFRHIDRLIAEANQQGTAYQNWRDRFPETCS
jgi:hypothetical protein